ncbi:MAG: diguanylate cyclase [Anaerolineaceae bacterium]|nr:diguanylate cyclase [Anaerolineaceae bacterium]
MKNKTNWFQTPKFDQVEKTIDARTMNLMLLGASLMLGVGLVFILIVEPTPINIGAALCCVPLIVINKLLLNRGKLFLCGLLFLIEAIVFLTFGIFSIGGIVPFTPLYLIVVLCAGIIFGVKGTLISFLVSVSIVAVTALLEWNGVVLPVLDHASLNGIIAMLVGSISIFLISFRFAEMRTAVLRQMEQQNEKVFTKEIDLEAEAAQMAPTPSEPLAQVMTCAEFTDELDNEIRRSRRYQRPLSLLRANIDFINEIKENYGIETANHITRMIYDLFQDSLRANVDLIARSDDKSFLVLLPETGRYAGYIVAERLRHKTELTTYSNKGELINLTISVGVTSLQNQGDVDGAEFIRQATLAANEAMRHGKNWTINYHDFINSGGRYY